MRIWDFYILLFFKQIKAKKLTWELGSSFSEAGEKLTSWWWSGSHWWRQPLIWRGLGRNPDSYVVNARNLYLHFEDMDVNYRIGRYVAVVSWSINWLEIIIIIIFNFFICEWICCCVGWSKSQVIILICDILRKWWRIANGMKWLSSCTGLQKLRIIVIRWRYFSRFRNRSPWSVR